MPYPIEPIPYSFHSTAHHHWFMIALQALWKAYNNDPKKGIPYYRYDRDSSDTVMHIMLHLEEWGMCYRTNPDLSYKSDGVWKITSYGLVWLLLHGIQPEGLKPGFIWTQLKNGKKILMSLPEIS